MARKQKRRPFRRPNPQQRNEEAAYRQQGIEAAARALIASHTLEQLRAELSHREMLLAEADQAAQFDPNPANLSRYRFAHDQYEAARTALKLSAQ